MDYYLSLTAALRFVAVAVAAAIAVVVVVVVAVVAGLVVS
jgi:hypothetical protein